MNLRLDKLDILKTEDLKAITAKEVNDVKTALEEFKEGIQISMRDLFNL